MFNLAGFIKLNLETIRHYTCDVIMVNIVIKNLSLNESKLSTYSRLSEARLARINSAVHDMDKRRLATSEIMVRDAAINTLGIRDEDIEFGVGPHGKPFLVGHEQFHYNVSHSGHMAVCAYGDEPVGVDIQEKRPHDMRVARRHFTSEEVSLLESTEKDGTQQDLFFEMWVKKEAYAKYLGVSVFETLNINSHDSRNTTFTRIKTEPNYICYLCTNLP